VVKCTNKENLPKGNDLAVEENLEALYFDNWIRLAISNTQKATHLLALHFLVGLSFSFLRGQSGESSKRSKRINMQSTLQA
jgi:hypothetical protein